MTALTAKEEQARRLVCLPLDGLGSVGEVKERVEELSPYVGLFKVGKESFTRFGPDIVETVTGYGSDVFLDLKYHDIPNTVRGAARAAAELGVAMFNVHASGGMAMMEAARAGVDEADPPSGKRPAILGVTVLTSLDEETLNQNNLLDVKVRSADGAHHANLARPLEGIDAHRAHQSQATDHRRQDRHHQHEVDQHIGLLGLLQTPLRCQLDICHLDIILVHQRLE